MIKRIGCIGLGNMGLAIVKGLLASQQVQPSQVWGVEADTTRAQALAAELGIQVFTADQPWIYEVGLKSDLILLAVKPWHVAGVVQSIAKASQAQGDNSPQPALASVAAGVTLAQLAQATGTQGWPMLRLMPNMPCLTGQGIVAVCGNAHVSPELLATTTQLMGVLGHSFSTTEDYFDVLTALVGSGPAFVLRLMKGLSDGAVASGLPRALANELIPKLLAGTAIMASQSPYGFAALEEQVTTPAGTTIAGLEALEQYQGSLACWQAIVAATQKAATMK